MPTNVPNGLMSIKQARQYLGGRSRSTIYDLIADKKIRAVKDGSRTLLVVATLDSYIAALPDAVVRPAHTEATAA